MTKAAIMGTYSDFKNVKTRSVIQIIIEIPIEKSREVFDALGYPLPGEEIHVAVAKLNPAALASSPKAAVSRDAPETGEGAVRASSSRSWDELSYAQRAGIRSNEAMFQEFCKATTPEGAAGYIRGFCNVESRSEIKAGTAAAKAFDALEMQYDTWIKYERNAA